MRIVTLFLLLLLPLQAESEELKVGTTVTLSGAYGTYGRQALHGIQMAVDEVNASGGVNGRAVKLLVEDFAPFDLKAAATSARKLIHQDKIELFLPLIIEDSEVVVPISTRAKIFSIAVGCGARKCGFNVGPYHSRGAASHDLIVQSLVDHAKAKHLNHVCVVAAAATYFEGYGKYIGELAKTAGMRVDYVDVPLSNSEDYRDVATRFKRDECEGIFAWIPIGSSGPFYRRVRETGSKALIFGIVETDDPQILSSAGPAAEGVVFARFQLGSEEFQRRFLERFKEPPSRPAIPSYDVVKLLFEIVAKVGTDPDAIKQELLKVKDRPATNGFLTYTTEGERLGEAVELMSIRDGRSVPLP